MRLLSLSRSEDVFFEMEMVLPSLLAMLFPAFELGVDAEEKDISECVESEDAWDEEERRVGRRSPIV